MTEEKVRCKTELGFEPRSLKVIGWHESKGIPSPGFRGVASFLTSCRPG